MTSTEFLKAFQKHLRVAEPKATELAAEMRQHLDELELNQDPVAVLGQPKTVAGKLNRVHIGWGWQPWMPFALLAAWLGLNSLFGMLMAHFNVSASTLSGSRLHTAIWFFNNLAWSASSLCGVIFLGWQMSRRRSPWRYLLQFLAVAFVLAVALSIRSMMHEPGTDQLWVVWLGGFEIGVAVSLFICFLAAFSMITFLPRRPVAEKRKKFAAVFEILLLIGLLVLGYFLIMVLSETLFQPYDTWFTDMRPRGSWVVAVNNFFETGWGTPLLLLIYSGFMIRRTVKNIRQLRQST